MLKDIIKYLPIKFRHLLSGINGNIQEVRLRVHKSIGVTINGIERYPQLDGTLSDSSNYGTICTKEDVLNCFDNICNHSVHSYSKEISQGYITLEGGNRVGICGTYVYKGNELSTIKDISSINIRISNEIRGSASSIYRLIDFSQPKGALLIGKPLSGKTTILRDLCRLVSNRYKVSLIDERSEIASIYNGIPQSDVGLKVDIFNGYPKDVGIDCAIRTMSPNIIFCDEIGSKADFTSLKFGAVCGVKFICTAHADSIEQVLKNPNFKDIFSTNIFDYIILLGSDFDIGKVLDFKSIAL